MPTNEEYRKNKALYICESCYKKKCYCSHCEYVPDWIDTLNFLNLALNRGLISVVANAEEINEYIILFSSKQWNEDDIFRTALALKLNAFVARPAAIFIQSAARGRLVRKC
jgi:hypothetical protein